LIFAAIGSSFVLSVQFGALQNPQQNGFFFFADNFHTTHADEPTAKPDGEEGREARKSRSLTFRRRNLTE